MGRWPLDRTRQRLRPLISLFASLVLLLLLGPIFKQRVFGVPVLGLLFSLVAAASVIASARSRLLFWISVLLVLPMLGALWSEPIFVMRSVNAASLGIRFVFLTFICGVILTGVLRDRVVTLDTIAGAASVYLLFGAAWACLFGFVQQLNPDSFFIPQGWEVTAATEMEPMPPLIYFSFATLTTVGYGDIHATSALPANLAVVEAITGQLYLTVLVARLVSLQNSQSERSRYRPT